MLFQTIRRSWLVHLTLALGAYSGESGSAEPDEEHTAKTLETESQIIVVFGASGRIGGLIVTEALARGHSGIGVSRSPEKLAVDHSSFSAVKGDVTSVDSFREVTDGADAVIISVQGSYKNKMPEDTVQARAASTAVVALSGVENAPYVLHFGGATSMFETKEAVLQNVPAPSPKGSQNYAKFLGHLVALQTFREADIDWTVLTPPFEINGWSSRGITDTRKKGSYRTSTTELITNWHGGYAGIMVADLAAAAIDEIENRQFVRQRFTVAN